MAKSNMLFDVLKNILVTKSESLYKEHLENENFKDASSYMIRKYLSMHKNGLVRNIVLENYLTLERMPDNIQYLWLLKNIPKQNNSFITFLK